MPTDYWRAHTDGLDGLGIRVVTDGRIVMNESLLRQSYAIDGTQGDLGGPM